MTTFDKREEGFEKQFAHDEELRFKANARRNKLLGLWAAEKLGLAGAEAEAYAKEVVMADFEEPGDDDVFRKVRKDFDAKGVAQSDHQIRRTMDELMAKAVAAIKAASRVATHSIVKGAMPSCARFPASPSRGGCAPAKPSYSGWCGLPYPIVAELVGREGFPAVTLDGQHGLWDIASIMAAIAHMRLARRGADRAHPGRRVRERQPRARFRRRRHRSRR